MMNLTPLLKEQSVDGILVSKPENITWLTGFVGSFGWVLYRRDGSWVLITDGRYEGKAKALVADKTEGSFMLYDASFKDRWGKLQSGRYLLEDSLTLKMEAWIKSLFPQAHFKVSSGIIDNLRRSKTEQELGMMKRAQDQVDRLLVPFLKSTLRLGITEREVAFALEHQIRGEGQFGLSFPAIVGFGENSALPHHSPSERKLRKNDNILIDCGSTYKGYCSDMTRNFVFGEPSPEYQKAFDLCLKAQSETLALYKSGVAVKDLDQHCRDIMGDEAQYYIHSLGHGVGLEIHEAPGISVRSDQVLVENEVVTCEPGLYYENQFGIRVEDILIVRKEGPEVLSNTSKELIIFN